MAVKIRLSRGGAKKRPFYHLVAADVRAPRDGKYIERLGFFNPMAAKDAEDRTRLNEERIQHWLKEGAQPTLRVQKLLAEAGLMGKPAIPSQTKQHLPKEKAQARAEEKAQKEADAIEAKKAAEEEAAAAAAAPAPAEEAPAEEVVAEEAEAPVEEATAEEVPAAEEAEAEEAEAPAEEEPKEE
ncbi:MAG: 30S ribosomal protein S16 [Alphaproteobacteria bacterium]